MGYKPSSFLTPVSQKRTRLKFIAYSSLFFIISVTVFIFAFSALRINDLKSEQAVVSSTYMSQLMFIAEGNADEDLSKLIPLFLGALVGDRVFDCIRINMSSTNSVYSWPTNSCNQDSKSIRITGVRKSDRSDIQIQATLDKLAPYDKYQQELFYVVISASLTGLIALLMANFAFNRAIRRPFENLLYELLEVLANADGKSQSNEQKTDDPKKTHIAHLSEAYDAILQRAKELKRKEAFWRSITDNSHDCVVSIDKQGCIIDFNTKAEKTFGYQGETVLGLQLSEIIVTKRNLAIWKRHFLSSNQENRVERQITELVRKDGTEFHAEFSVRDITVDDDQFFTIYILDVTEVRKQQAELQKAKDSAQEASKAKSSFLAMMSHEIRTPLNAVYGALGLINPSGLDSSQKEFLQVGKKGAENLLLIINDILDFSRIEAGKLVLEPVLFDPQQIIEDIFQILQPRLMEKQIALVKGSGFDKVDYLMGDVSRIRQILLNLCSNAVRFTDQGYVRVDYSCSYSEGNNIRVLFSVKDTGIGVSKDNQAHLFEEFWGQNNSGAQSNRGTGLGLPISKKLVEMMGGEISFQSEKGVGSTFCFELPLLRATPDATAENIKQRNLKIDLVDENISGLQGRVLLAEDNVANQLISQAMIKRIGLQVDVVANGYEAIEAVNNLPYDVVIMDVNMPELDGIAATKVIRKLPNDLAKIPIVAMTALAMPGDKEKLFAAGMDYYLSKPVIQNELYTILLKIIKKMPIQDTEQLNNHEIEMHDHEPMLIDFEILLQLSVDVGLSSLRQIINAYLSDLPSQVEAINTAVSLGNCPLLTTVVHPLKSSSAAIGAMRLSDLAGALESAGKEQDLEQIKISILALENTADQTKGALHAIDWKNL